jgi:asparagine synthase (glutamine-hydrolysing)
MSGLCGQVNLDGAPVGQGALRGMMARLVRRGPDGQGTRIEGPCGLGHTLLHVDLGEPSQPQPSSLDGQVWITADARIDGQAELKRHLRNAGRKGLEDCSDACLVLHAYCAWGERCVDHLIGDFAFAIWDGGRRRLICARDHFGVKPFYYSLAGRSLVFGNTFESVRAHPAVAGDLDELAIADFLLFEESRDPAATGIAAIRRLPAASMLVADASGMRIAAYWSLPEDPQVREGDDGDSADRLRELLEVAVGDRLRTNRVAVQMSGGLDSTAVAATAKQLLERAARPFDLQAHTVVYDRLIADEERWFAGAAARHLAIPIVFCPADDYALYERFASFQARLPEPFHGPDVVAGLDCLRSAASGARVLLTGYDGDTVLNESPRPYFRRLLHQRVLGRLAWRAGRHGLRALQRRAFRPARRSEPVAAPRFPDWIAPPLQARWDLRDRWREFHRPAPPTFQESIRPGALRFLAQIMRSPSLLEQYDPGVTGLALDCRHPFLDLRLVEFCLGLAPAPWCVEKECLRQAMRGFLPDAILRRPKTPLADWPAARLLAEPRARWVDRFVASPGLEQFVDRARIPAVAGAEPSAAWVSLRPLTLNYWMEAMNEDCSMAKESRHETA